MSAGHVLAFSSATPNDAKAPDRNRRSANFHPSIWGDRFLSYGSDSMETTDDIKINKEILELKEEVRSMIVAPTENPSEKLDLIDTIQRLGVSYHFQNELETILKQIYHSLYRHDENHEDDLYTVALCFRLLRQQGFKVSYNVFDKFKNKEGKFMESLASDVRGMLSLYEASFLRVHGDDILDEAIAFTTSHLKNAVLSHLGPTSLMDQVVHALKQPIRKGLTRLEARHYMSIYQQDPTHNKVLLTFAKLDFNLLQKVHQKELSHIARWWKELDFARKLPFARDRVIECYFWILGVYFEPQYAFARRTMTKMKIQTRAYFQEAKWFHQKYVPTLEEYMPLALVTSGYPMLATTSFVGMGDIFTKDSFEWLNKDPKIVRASAVVSRLMDDIVSHKFEQKRGHVASAVECFMKDYDATEEDAVKELSKQVVDAWKDINEECLFPTSVPMPLLTRVLNLARVIDVVYKDEDGYTHAGVVLKDSVASMLINSVPE